MPLTAGVDEELRYMKAVSNLERSKGMSGKELETSGQVVHEADIISQKCSQKSLLLL